MGASKSKVEVNKMMDIASKILNKTIAENSSTIQQNQRIEIKEAKGDINISNINWSQFAQINMQALSSSKVNNEITQQLTEALTAQATATSEALSLSVNSSQNLSNLTTKLSSEIANEFTQKCSQHTGQTQEIVIGIAGSNVNITAVNWDQYAKQAIECTLNAVAKSATVAEVESIIDVGATAEGKGLLSGPLLFIILIIAIVGLVIYKGVSGGTEVVTTMVGNKWFWITIIALIGGYFTFAYLNGSWPFKSSEEKKNKFASKDGCTTCSGGCGYNLMSRYQENFTSSRVNPSLRDNFDSPKLSSQTDYIPADVQMDLRKNYASPRVLEWLRDNPPVEFPSRIQPNLGMIVAKSGLRSPLSLGPCGKYVVPKPIVEKCCGEYPAIGTEPWEPLPSWT